MITVQLAARRGWKDIVELLIVRGEDPHTKNSRGETALHGAAAYGHVDVVALLLEEGANIDTKDYSGRTPLSLAADCGQEHVVRFLLNNGVNVDRRDIDRRTVLHRLTWWNKIELKLIDQMVSRARQVSRRQSTPRYLEQSVEGMASSAGLIGQIVAVPTTKVYSARRQMELGHSSPTGSPSQPHTPKPPADSAKIGPCALQGDRVLDILLVIVYGSTVFQSEYKALDNPSFDPTPDRGCFLPSC